MKFAVIVFPGSNCDIDMYEALHTVLGVEVDYVSYRAESLAGYDAVMLPGGFSYGDYLRAGAIARFAPIIPAVKKMAAAGKLVLGVCNGFQILTEIGLLPGALKQNESQQFVAETSTLLVANDQTPFTHKYQVNQRLAIPIAHGEGCYYADQTLLDELERKQQIVFRYVNNPNGSVNDIAGICNEEGNVLGMMPHPERAVETILGSADGLGLFQSMVEKQVQA